MRLQPGQPARRRHRDDPRLPGTAFRLLRIAGVGNDDHQLRTRPAAKTWSPLEYIAHAGAAIDWYARRVDRALTEHSPAFEAFD
jgi:hypothetical protein